MLHVKDWIRNTLVRVYFVAVVSLSVFLGVGMV